MAIKREQSLAKPAGKTDHKESDQLDSLNAGLRAQRNRSRAFRRRLEAGVEVSAKRRRERETAASSALRGLGPKR